jgi:hypothetical protein
MYNLYQEIQYEFDSCIRLANISFNKYLETGSEKAKSDELWHLGGAQALLRLKIQLESLGVI